MRHSNEYEIVELQRFIEATRDSGYKSTAASIAELLDNSFEAGATEVKIDFCESTNGQIQVSVEDNGCGMSPSVLRLALRFGGTTRFNSRKGAGRYGMGLPNSSLSRARRVDVFSWTAPNVVWWSYLDVDEIASGKLRTVPKPKRVKPERKSALKPTRSGTVVIWSKCDRLDYKNVKKLVSKLTNVLGQTFRRHICSGSSLRINGTKIKPIDPLFLHKGNNIVGATPFGEPISYQIRVPGKAEDFSTIIVRFTELPIEKWHSFSNDEKRGYGITKGAGVSIVRSGREVDYGWFFMGSKRKENYDDWWRCEIQFDARLDELFGVTHTKQAIHPSGVLNNILSPDIERIAHVLNGRVRARYLSVKSKEGSYAAKCRAESRDHWLEPPEQFTHRRKLNFSSQARINGSIVSGLAYRMEHKCLDEPSFFVPVSCGREVIVLLNEEHPFYERVYYPVIDAENSDPKALHCYLDLMLFAAARAECSITSTEKLKWAKSMREAWSKTLATFLD